MNLNLKLTSAAQETLRFSRLFWHFRAWHMVVADLLTRPFVAAVIAYKTNDRTSHKFSEPNWDSEQGSSWLVAPALHVSSLSQPTEFTFQARPVVRSCIIFDPLSQSQFMACGEIGIERSPQAIT